MDAAEAVESRYTHQQRVKVSRQSKPDFSLCLLISELPKGVAHPGARASPLNQFFLEIFSRAHQDACVCVESIPNQVDNPHEPGHLC